MRIRQLAVIFAFAPLLLGQVREHVTVEVVDVPVYVFNSNGPVRNLTKENFELFVNGRRQAIDYFDAIDFTTGASQVAVTAPRDPRDRRLFVLLFDLVFTRPAAIDRARKAAVKMIEDGAAADYFAVVTFTMDKGPQFIAPFTNDHAVLRRAVLTLSESETHDPLALAISPGERKVVEGYTLADGEITMDSIVSTLTRVNAELEGRMMPVKRLIEEQINSFDSIGSRLAQLDGYKHVIVLSEGFNPYVVYSNPGVTDPRMLQMMQSMHASFRRANAIVDTIDLGEADRSAMLSDALHMMARETGGQFVARATNIAGALQRIAETSAQGYRLGFNLPRNAKKDNTIDVKLRNAPRGTTLSFRKGFSTGTPAAAPDDGLRLADIVLNDIPQTGIAPTIVFRVKPYVDVDVPAEALGGGEGDVLLYVFDAKGAVVEFKQRHIPAAGTVRGKIDLPPGPYVVKALVRIGDSIGFARQAFVIP